MQRKFSIAGRTVFLSAALLSMLGVLPARGHAAPFQDSPQHAHLSQISRLILIAPHAISPQGDEADVAIKLLREAGPIGITALQTALEETLRDYEKHPEKKAGNEWRRIQRAFEIVGAQRDNWASGLYWFTDLSAAKAEAKKQNKPILSFGLSGNLNEELSDDDARFFRTALYTNAPIKKFLRENYILHRQAVKPAPKATIDLSDHRKIETTSTANNIH